MSPQRPSRAERWLVSLARVTLFAGLLFAVGTPGAGLGIRQGVVTTHKVVGSAGSPEDFGGVRALSIQAGP